MTPEIVIVVTITILLSVTFIIDLHFRSERSLIFENKQTINCHNTREIVLAALGLCC